MTDCMKPVVEIAGGNVASPTEWRKWGDAISYHLTKEITVLPVASLTIDPGTVVKLGDVRLVVSGLLNAEGMVDDPIFFTSQFDDSVGGDSTGDGDATRPNPGDWRGIYLGPQATESRVRYCRFQYAGGESVGNLNGSLRRAVMYVDKSAPLIQSNAFLSSAGNGLDLFGSGATVADNSFTDMAEDRFPIAFHGLNSFPTFSNNQVQGTGQKGIEVPAGKLAVSGTWESAGLNLPYLPQGELWIPVGQSLTLGPGVRMEIAGHRIVVEGLFNVNGTGTERVIIGGRTTPEGIQPWNGIYFAPAATGSKLRYAFLRDAGGADLGVFAGDWRRTAVYVNRANIELSELIILGSGGSGVEFESSEATIRNSVISNSTGPGVVARGQGGNPGILYSTIVENGGAGAVVENSMATLNSNVLAFNGDTGVTGTFFPAESSEAVQNNLFFMNGETNVPDWLETESGLRGDNLAGDPLFVSADSFNYRLLAGSSAIDAGGSDFAEPYQTDLEGRVRLHGDRVDIGAIEFGGEERRYTVDLSARRPDQVDWTGEGILSPAKQSFVSFLPGGMETEFILKVRNAGNQPEDYTLLGGTVAESWSVRALLESDEDITASLFSTEGFNSGGSLPGDELLVRVLVTPPAGAGSGVLWATRVVVNGSQGGTDLLDWSVAVVPLPSIAEQPQSATVEEGESLSLSAGASGTGGVSYQWRFNGEIIPGATSAEFRIEAALPSNAGEYSVDVMGRSGVVSSEIATVVVNPAPIPPVEPDPITVSIATSPEGLQLNWVGGMAPFQVWGKVNVTDEAWEVVAEGLTESQFLIDDEGDVRFFRVVSN